eukprot:scaffold6_cov245-Pinguiococcus_pyrenoidosus.AAC.11
MLGWLGRRSPAPSWLPSGPMLTTAAWNRLLGARVSKVPPRVPLLRALGPFLSREFGVRDSNRCSETVTNIGIHPQRCVRYCGPVKTSPPCHAVLQARESRTRDGIQSKLKSPNQKPQDGALRGLALRSPPISILGNLEGTTHAIPKAKAER